MTKKKNILIVDDEKDALHLIEKNMELDEFNLKMVKTGEEALKIVRGIAPDLVLLNMMIPGVDGFGLCRVLKRDPKTSKIPIIMMARKEEERDIIGGLELGADDYVTKPFKPQALIARINAILRRKPAVEPDEFSPLKIDGLELVPKRFQVKVDGKLVDVTLTEFRILHFLALRPGLVFTRQQIIDGVRGNEYPATDRSVDVQMTGLRRKIGRYCCYIETVRGVGYKFKNY